MATELIDRESVKKELERLRKVVGDESQPLEMRAHATCQIIDARREELLAGVDQRVDRVRLIEGVKLLIREQAERVCGCTLSSVVRSVKSAMLSGLVVSGYKREVDFIPRNRKVSAKGKPDKWVKELSADPNYRGLIHFVRNTGRLSREPFVECVFTGESLTFEGDADQLRVKHTLDPLNEHRRKQDWSQVVACYARWYFVDGRVVDHFMSREQIEEHRNKYSKQFQDAEKNGRRDSTWHKEPIKMAMKTVIRDAVNRDRVPCSQVDRAMIDAAQRVESGEPIDTDYEIVDEDSGTAVIEDQAEQATVDLVKVFDAYIEQLATAIDVRAAGAVYDAHFGPEASYAWSDEQTQAGYKAFNERKDEVRSK